MANLGDMVISIVGDTTGLNKSLTESQKKMAAFGVNVAAVTAAMIQIGKQVSYAVKEFSDYGSAIYDAGQKTGLSTDAIQEWKFIAEQSGTTLEAVTGSVGMMTRGLKTNAAEFEKLGIAVKNSDGSFKSTTEIFNDTVKTLSAMTDETERDQMAFKLLGRSAQSLIPILNAGESGIAGMKDEAHRLGLVLSKETISNADKLGDSTDALKASMANAKHEIINNLSPALIKIADNLKEAITKTIEWQKYIDALKGKAQSPTELSQAIKGVVESTKELNRQLTDPAYARNYDAIKKQIDANILLEASLRAQAKAIASASAANEQGTKSAQEKAAVDAEAAAKAKQASDKATQTATTAAEKASELRRIELEEITKTNLLNREYQEGFEKRERDKADAIENTRIENEDAFQSYIEGWKEADVLVYESAVESTEARVEAEQSAASAISSAWTESYMTVMGVVKSVFTEMGTEIAQGELSWNGLATAAVNSIGEIVSALGDQLAADAAKDLALAIAATFTNPIAAPALYSSAAIKSGGAAAAWAAGATLKSVKLAEGGVVMPKSGGTIAQIAEAGQPEAVIPLDKLNGMGGDIHLVVNMDSKPFLDKIFPATRDRTILISAGAVV